MPIPCARKFTLAAIALSAGLVVSGSAQAQAPCGGNFGAWLNTFQKEAAASGLPQRIISTSLRGVGYDKRVVAYDRRQSNFTQTFLKFSGRMVAQYRLDGGRQRLKQYASTFKRIQKEFGVPGPVLVAFWGLETDFGANQGKFNTLQSLATLAYDCRRPDLFRPQLMDALRIIQRGDLRSKDMVGAWAGEIGQMQFLPTDYLESGVDYDGDGRVDLRRSVPDVLASSANLLRKHGWRPGEPWLQEVRVPGRLPWDQADIAISHPRSQWAKWGVTRVNGKKIKADNLPASLLLPMGRNGPAFLAYKNFTEVYLTWNRSLTYATTAAYFATRLAGARKVRPGNGQVTPLNGAQMKQLQQKLANKGYDVGKIDGVLGAGTRAAVKAEQQRLGLPADSYPDTALLGRL
ncbi:MAG: lytic murein transglycosylase [Hyphomicrobiales bacterium]